QRGVVHDGAARVPGGGGAPMRTASRGLRPRRRPPRMVRSRLRRTRRPPSAPRRTRRWREALAALIAALLLWIFWPAPAPPADDPLVAAPKAGGAKSGDKTLDQLANKAPDKPAPSRPRNAGPAPRPKTPQPSALVRARRDLLLA